MSKFTPTTSRTGACEICGDESGKCRRLLESDLHLCMTFADARKGEVYNGYQCVKPDSQGKGWATFKLDNSQDWSEQQRREWHAQVMARQQHRAIEQKTRFKRSLSAVERDKFYRQLLSELELHRDDRADLKHRGFSDAQIQQIGFKSLTQNHQPLRNKYPESLPGIHPSGRKLLNLGVGYLCPIRNQDGFIVACQLRLRKLIPGQKNRYRWLSGGHAQRQTLHFFPSNGNPDGELPLAICRPQNKPRFVALAEGTGAKPNLVAYHWGAFTVGAAGGQWLASPETLKKALDTGISESGDRCIRLYPDAGDLQNRPVAMRWQQIILTLQRWGYSVVIGWWNQRTKTDCDIDELTPEEFAGIRYLKPRDFLALLAEQFPQQGFDPQLPPVVAPPHTGQAWDLWRNSRLFAGDHQSNTPYFEAPIPVSGTATYIRSGTGTGKTHWLRQIIKDLVRQGDQGFLSIGYRNSLLIQFAENDELAGTWHHLQQDLKDNRDHLLLIRDPLSKILCCIDSLTYFYPEDFEDKIIILDEVESIVDQLLKANTAVSYQRERIKYLFTEMLKRADRIIFLDGHLRNSTVEYLQNLMGHCKKPVRYLNIYAGNKGRVEFLEGVKTDNGIGLNDRSSVIQALSSNTERFVVGSDSQEEIEALERLFQQQGRKTLRFDSTTSRSRVAQQFLKNPAQYLRHNEIEILLYTPSAEAGLNIDIQGYFSDAYFLFFGVITTNAQLQLIARVRDPQMHLHIWCSLLGLPAQSIAKSPLPEKLTEEIKQYVLDCATASLTGLTVADAALNLAQQLIAFSADRHFDHEMLLTALENHERANLRHCLREALRDSGYQVESVFGQKFHLTGVREQRAEIRQQKSLRIYQAKDITTEESHQKARNFSATEEERYQVSRRRLLDRLPGIETVTYQVQVPVTIAPIEPTVADPGESVQFTDSSSASSETQPPITATQTLEKPIFDADFIRRVKWEDRHLISQLELRWLLEHPDVAKQLQQLRWHKRLTLFTDPEQPDGNRRMNLSDYQSRWLKICRLQEMGIHFFLQPGASWHSQSLEALNFWQKGKISHHARAIGRRVGQSSVCAYIGEILESLGLKTHWVWGKDHQGQKTRIYSLCQKTLHDPLRHAIFEAVGRRFTMTLTKELPLLDWQALTGLVEKAQTQTEQALGVRSPIDNLLTHQTVSDPALNTSGVVIPDGSPQLPPRLALTVSQSPDLLQQAAQAIEGCQSIQDFLRLGHQLLKDKSETFIYQVLQRLVPPTLQRVLAWSSQLRPSSG